MQFGDPEEGNREMVLPGSRGGDCREAVGCREEAVQSYKRRAERRGSELDAVVRGTESQLGLLSCEEVSWVRGQGEHF